MSPWGAAWTDEVGIVRLATDSDEPWPGVPPAVADLARTAQGPDDILPVMLDGPRRWPVSLQRVLLHPASAVPAVLAPLRAGGSALDLGSGRLGLSPALASFGATVTRADWIYSRLRFARLMHPAPGVTDVLVGRRGLPEQLRRRFDVVFLDLEAFADVPALLAEVHRLLRPSGTVVAAAIDHRARLAWRAPSRALRTPSLRTLTRRAGMTLHDEFVPLPDAVTPRALVPVPRLPAHLSAHRRYSGAKAVAARVLGAVRASRLLATDRFLVLTPRGAAREASVARRAVSEERKSLVLSLSDARAGVLGTATFAKVALSADQQQALTREAEKTVRARQSAFAPYVLERAHLRRREGVVSVAYPAVAVRPDDPAAAAAVIGDALASLDPSQVSPLQHTPLWRRLTSDRGQRDIADLGAHPLWEWLSVRCHDSSVPVGPNHGDLHVDNVLVPASGRPVLVDWNRFEESNPLLLDPLYAAILLDQESSGRSFAESLELAASGRLEGSLVGRACSVRGDLDPEEATVLVLLDRVASYSLPRRRFKPWTMPPFEEAVDRVSSLVQRSGTPPRDEPTRPPNPPRDGAATPTV